MVRKSKTTVLGSFRVTLFDISVEARKVLYPVPYVCRGHSHARLHLFLGTPSRSPDPQRTRFEVIPISENLVFHFFSPKCTVISRKRTSLVFDDVFQKCR